MNIKNVKVIFGFGGNAEMVVSYDDSSPSPKKVARDIKITLAGGAVTSAYVTQRYGGDKFLAKLLIATAQEPNIRDSMLKELLSASGIERYSLLPIRESGKTGLAIQLLTTNTSMVVGDKGSILYEPSPEGGLLPENLVFNHVKPYNCHTWRVATGVLPEELKLVYALFEGTSKGKVLNPRIQFSSMVVEFSDLARQAHMVIMNDHEYGGFVGKAAKDLQSSDFAVWSDRGLSPLLVVTKNNSGVTLVYDGETIVIPAYHHGQLYSEVGAGDWWLGSFLAYLLMNNIDDLASVTKEQFLAAAKFATVAAGLKVTYKNGNLDGPPLHEVEEHLGYY